MKIIMLMLCAVLAITFMTYSLWQSKELSALDREETKKSTHDSSMIAIAIEAHSIAKGLAGQGNIGVESKEKQSAHTEESTVPSISDASLVHPSISSRASNAMTYSHGKSNYSGHGSYLLRKVIKSGFPDIELQVDPNMMKEIAQRFKLQLAIACYKDSVLKFVALVRNPFQDSKFSTDLSSLQFYSSRPRSDELPLDVSARIKDAANANRLWSNDYFLCWLVPVDVEQLTMALQTSAIKSAGLAPFEVTKTIGFYDASLAIRFSALETKSQGTILYMTS